MKAKGGYQRVALPDGSSIEGDDRGYLADIVFAKAQPGFTFLDVGSFHGYFCLEALRRGASKATGIEPYSESVRLARHIASQWDLHPEYVESDLESWDAGNQRYDIVLCANVLHHSFDPIHALRRMMGIAKEAVVLEMAGVTWRDVLKRTVPLLSYGGRSTSQITLGSARRNMNVASRTYLFSPKAIATIFNEHSGAFEPIKVSPSPFKGRYTVEARKRRIKHLTVVAGPTSVGKSWFIKRLRDPAFAQQHGLSSAPFTEVTAGAVPKLPAEAYDHLLLHYDLLRPWGRSIRSYARDPVLDLLSLASNVDIVTLTCPRDILIQRFQQSEMQGKRRSRHRRILEFYGDEVQLKSWYKNWQDFCKTISTHREITIENI